MEQRRFAAIGQNLFLIVSKFINNQKLCQLLYYTDSDPLSLGKTLIDGKTLINKNILIVPKIPDTTLEKNNFIIITFGDTSLNPRNKEFKISDIRINIICPFDEWVINNNSLRPFLIMQEVDIELNEQRIAGIGNLTFSGSSPLIVSSEMGGYNMRFTCNEFN